jgi:hypothetical protein
MISRGFYVAGALALPAMVAGCATMRGHRGQVVQPQVGTPYMDFTYVGDDGKPHRLSEHLGDFTVLAFTKCGGDLHGPVSRELAELVRVTEEHGVVRTIGFDIHWSENGCPQGKSCHLIEQNANLYSICDARGIVRDLYGADRKNQIFVIGPDGKIIDSAPATQFEALKTRFRRVVQDYAARKREALPQEET